MKLLIVDDHAGVRALIRQLATPPALEVRECASAAAALATLRDFSPDLVTMDIRLGDLDGIEATRAVLLACPSTQVVVVTAYEQAALQRAANEAGAAHFLPKDHLFELPHVIACLIPKAGAREEAQS
jgi:DNA-binding NarL/FixJ family response regulator